MPAGIGRLSDATQRVAEGSKVYVAVGAAELLAGPWPSLRRTRELARPSQAGLRAVRIGVAGVLGDSPAGRAGSLESTAKPAAEP